MNILWLAWKDYTHPQRGGAEVVLRELLQRQVREGHRVTLLTARHKGAAAHEIMDGIDIIRVGSNRYLHPAQALAYYMRHLRGRFDMIIETVNTAPYFSLLFRGRAKGYALYHQLARQVWFHETKSPLSQLGYYVIEPATTWLLGRSRTPLITVSESTKQDLARFGWKRDGIHIISEGIEMEPVADLAQVTKFDRPTMLSFGALRGMKRTLDQVQAFEFAKRRLPELQLKIAGDASDPYGQRVLDYIRQSQHAADIEYLGRVSLEDKIDLMRRSHVLAVTSIKEGWGLVVTEAASQGTPAVVYDADGLRDSVKNGVTGLVTTPSPAALAIAIIKLLENQELYDSMQSQAWQWSKQLTFDQSYQDFKHITEGAAV